MTGNVVTLPAKTALERRHRTTEAEMRAMVRNLALWMHDQGVENIALTRTPGTALFKLTIDGRPLSQ